MSAITSSEQILIVLILIGLVCLVTAACFFDYCDRRIPNVLTFGGAFIGACLNIYLSGFDGFVFSLGGLSVGFCFLMPGYLLGQTGAGDVKLLASVGAFIGPYAALVASSASVIVGAMMALALAFVGEGRRPWRRYASMLRCLLITRQWVYVPPQEGEVMAQSFPFAPAIAVGAIVASFYFLKQNHTVIYVS